MAADIAQGTAVPLALEKPSRAQLAVQPMRSQAYGLHDPADRAGANELDGAGHGCHLEPLGIIDRPDASRLGDGPAECRELIGGGAAGLVRHHVLPVAHRLDRDRGAVRGDRGGEDQLHRRILEQVLLVGDAGNVRVAPDETGEGLRLALGPVADAFAAERQETPRHFIDMAMIETDRRELYPP